ncbi:MAG: TauD/TfdA dioxygenase family protein [Burkholderiales bacterium]
MAQGKVCLAADVSAVAMTPDLGAEVRGVDLSAPLSDACFARILHIFHRYSVIYLRSQALDARLLARFAARFGEAELASPEEHPLPGLPQVSVLGDSARDSGQGGLEPSYWHSDRSHEVVPPAVTLLYGMNGADGGSAEFVNMYSVFNALSPEKQLLVQKLRGLHVARALDPAAGLPETAGAQCQVAEHPLVRVHPDTGKRALYLAKEVVARAAGLREDDSRKLIEQLEAFATQPRFVYAHRWRKGDLLIWDNRCTLHRMSFEPRSDRALYRIRVRGETPIAG